MLKLFLSASYKLKIIIKLFVYELQCNSNHSVSPFPTVPILHSAKVHARLIYMYMNSLKSLRVSQLQTDSVPGYFSIWAVKLYPQI